MNSPRKTVLYATDAMCIVCEAESLGQKSSEALTTAFLFELSQRSTIYFQAIALSLSIRSFRSKIRLPVQVISVVAHATYYTVVAEIPCDGSFKSLLVLPRQKHSPAMATA